MTKISLALLFFACAAHADMVTERFSALKSCVERVGAQEKMPVRSRLPQNKVPRLLLASPDEVLLPAESGWDFSIARADGRVFQVHFNFTDLETYFRQTGGTDRTAADFYIPVGEDFYSLFPIFAGSGKIETVVVVKRDHAFEKARLDLELLMGNSAIYGAQTFFPKVLLNEVTMGTNDTFPRFLRAFYFQFYAGRDLKGGLDYQAILDTYSLLAFNFYSNKQQRNILQRSIEGLNAVMSGAQERAFVEGRRGDSFVQMMTRVTEMMGERTLVDATLTADLESGLRPAIEALAEMLSRSRGGTYQAHLIASQRSENIADLLRACTPLAYDSAEIASSMRDLHNLDEKNQSFLLK